ncbi:MAG: MMPL family transporter [Chloroflexi bacterium]|nr:MMPL family transporter [Chloroflexota bacterium]
MAVRYRWAVIAAWAVLLLLALPLAPRASSVLKAGFGRADTESQRGLELLTNRMGVPEASITLVFQSSELAATDPRFIEAEQQALAPLAASPRVARIVTHYNAQNQQMVSPDGHTAYALALLTDDINTAMDHYPELRALVRSEQLQVQVTGGIAVFADLNAASERDLRRAEVLSLPIVLVALVLVFGSAVAAGLPLAMGALSVALTLALIALLAQSVDMSVFVLNIATMLGLGVAVDYSLLVVNRFREELRQRDRREAVAVAMSTAGRALLFSGATTILGLSGLLFFKFMMLRSLGISGIIVIGVSLLVATTLLPAILAVLGPRVNAWAIIPAREAQASWWHRIATGVMRHPFLVMVPVSIGLVVLGLPFLQVKIGSPWVSVLPPDSEARAGWETLTRAFGPAELSPVMLLVTSEKGTFHPDTVGTLYDFTHRLAQDPRVVRVESIATLAPGASKEQYQQLYRDPQAIPVPDLRKAVADLARPDITLVRVFPRGAPLSDESKALVQDIRSSAPRDGVQVFASGLTADLLDSTKVMYGDFPWVVAYIMVTIYLALLVLFRSVVLPLKAVVMNTLSIFASYGALVFIFQQGHFQRILGFTADGTTESTIPILLFCILFGLSMDYEVFMLARIKEVYDATRDNTGSVALGLERTGRIVTSAALILVIVTGAFATGDIVIVKALGLGMAIAIFLDATVVRALLVPATMRVLGNVNWWAPAWLRGRGVAARVGPP